MSKNAEEIYKKYPRKVGKLVAIKSIEKALRAVDFNTLLDRVSTYAEAVSMWSDEDKRFVPHPSTWFNQGRYDDDPSEWDRSSSTKNKMGFNPNNRSEWERGWKYYYPYDECPKTWGDVSFLDKAKIVKYFQAKKGRL